MNAFYGDPRGKDGKPSLYWETNHIVRVPPPFEMTYAGTPIRGIAIHKRCAESLAKVLESIWIAANKQQSVIDETGASVYGGGYNYRLMRNSNYLSTHSWGAAIDLDPARNGMGDVTPNFANHMWIVDAFEAEGWVWGGRWRGRSCDGMHFQAARI
jgi:hypothetical protein